MKGELLENTDILYFIIQNTYIVTMQNKQKEQMKMNCHLNKDTIYDFLFRCNDHFPVDLSSIVNLSEYSEKLSKYSTQTCYYVDDMLVGILMYYSNHNIAKKAFVPIICNIREYQGRGIGKKLVTETLSNLLLNGYNSVGLEVHKTNPRSINLFLKHGFEIVSESRDLYILEKILRYNEEYSIPGKLKFQFV